MATSLARLQYRCSICNEYMVFLPPVEGRQPVAICINCDPGTDIHHRAMMVLAARANKLNRSDR